MLQDKVALVTGSTRGIGWAVAQAFAAHGATVILNGTHAEAVDARTAELAQRQPGRVFGLRADVSDPHQVKELYTAIFRQHQRLDVLVNNAGILDDNLLGMIGAEAVARTFAVNVHSVLYNMQYAARLMARAKGGSIVNMASIIGRFGNEGQTLYGSSKAAIIGATLSAAKELAVQNIRVNAIAPGLIDTDMTRRLPKEKFDKLLASVKMRRIGRPEDVAHVALFLASDYSAYVTGQVIGVDGGMLV
jgi:3-oxoacyl-[acyl-carrier protein] reductase